MRITGGSHRGRKISSPDGLDTRPTSDRARQAVFNILHHAGWRTRDLLDGAAVLDVFAGTGALGLEALSHGAGDALFIEQSPAAVRVCQQNIRDLGLDAAASILKCDALHPLPLPAGKQPRDLVFLDPPYAKNLGAAALKSLAAKGWIAPGAVIVMEMAKKNPEILPDIFVQMDERAYGVALVKFCVYNP